MATLIRVNKTFSHLLIKLKANHLDEYKTIGDIVTELIINRKDDLIDESTKISLTAQKSNGLSSILIDDEVFKLLKEIQARYKTVYKKHITLGDIAEELCAKSMRAAIYRELVTTDSHVNH